MPETSQVKVEDPELERIVVLRFFGGLSNEEIAETVGLSKLTLDRQWAKEHEAALSELEQARKIIESGFDAGRKNGRWDRGLWFDWVFARVLLHEASESLPAKHASAQGSAL